MIVSQKQKVFVGMDMHRDDITVTVLSEFNSQPLFEKKLPNYDRKVKRFFDKVGSSYQVYAAYEAGNCGFGLYRKIRSWGHNAYVVAPNSIPRNTSERRRKTDRRDSLSIARLIQTGHVETVRLPDEVWESHRSLVRTRYTIAEELAKQKTRVVMILLSRGYVYRDGKNWSDKYWQWVNKIQLLPHEQLPPPSAGRLS